MMMKLVNQKNHYKFIVCAQGSENPVVRKTAKACLVMMTSICLVTPVFAKDKQEQEFYTIVDAQGRLITVPAEPSTSQNDSDDPVNKTNMDTQQQSSKVTISQTTISKTTKDKSGLLNDSITDKNTASKKQNVEMKKKSTMSFGDDTYIDSQALTQEIQQKIKQKEKERFYAVPNSNGGIDFIKNNDNGLLPVEDKTFENFELSSSYQTISSKELTQLLPDECIPKQHLTEIKVATADKTVELWPRIIPKKFKKERAKLYKVPSEFVAIDDKVSFLRLTSFASKKNNPTYYWPLTIFLDGNGCMISASKNIIKETKPATWRSNASITGNVKVPAKTKFMMLTPLQSVPDMANVRLIQEGELSIISLNGQR